MWSLVSKTAAIVIAIGCIVATIIDQRELNRNVLAVVISTLLPLALIWFPEALGSFTGYVGRGGNVDTETPPSFIAFMGWFLLVGLPALLYWFWHHK